MAYTLHLPEVKRVLHLMYAYKMSGHTKVIILCINCEVNRICQVTILTWYLEKNCLSKIAKTQRISQFIKNLMTLVVVQAPTGVTGKKFFFLNITIFMLYTK